MTWNKWKSKRLIPRGGGVLRNPLQGGILISWPKIYAGIKKRGHINRRAFCYFLLRFYDHFEENQRTQRGENDKSQLNTVIHKWNTTNSMKNGVWNGVWNRMWNGVLNGMRHRMLNGMWNGMRNGMWTEMRTEWEWNEKGMRIEWEWKENEIRKKEE